MFITNSGTNSDFDQARMKERLSKIIPSAKAIDILVGFFYFSGINELETALRGNADVKLRILVGMDAERLAGTLVEIANDRQAKTRDDGGRVETDAELAAAAEAKLAAVRSRFREDLKKLYATDSADSPDFLRRFQLYCDLLKSGRLEIRKTKEENHAKLYLFELRDDCPFRHTWITGSSNLSKEGMGDRAEFNIELGEICYDYAHDYFERLWETAINLVDERDDPFPPLPPALSLSPYEGYLLLLKNYVETRERYNRTHNVKKIFEIPRNEFDKKKPKYTPFKYQIDAVEQARVVIDEFNGVILADVVGLGKSIIGSVLATSLFGNARGIVIAPPGLRAGWEEYLNDFQMDKDNRWQVFSSGNLEAALEYVHKQGGAGATPVDTVIVDEAHNFRNEDTRSYAFLSMICRGRRVILMTATPFNNEPREIFALLKLFIGGRDSRLLADGELEEKFKIWQDGYAKIGEWQKKIKADFSFKNLTTNERKELRKIAGVDDLAAFDAAGIREKLNEHAKFIARNIRVAIAPVVIRRNRIDLLEDEEYREEIADKITLPENPQEQFFELLPEQSEFYDRVVGKYFGEGGEFVGAIYQPIVYTKFSKESRGGVNADDELVNETQQVNMAKFMRRLLVKRFESSFAAFAETLKNVKGICEKVQQLAFPKSGVGGRVPVSSKARDLIGDDVFVGDDTLFKKVAAATAEKLRDMRESGEVYLLDEDFTDKGRADFKRDLERDIALFEKIIAETEKLALVENDPKVEALAKAISRVFSGEAFPCGANDPAKRKVLVFSEYADTVSHVGERLAKVFPDRVKTVGELTKTERKSILKNFDGSVPQKDQEDKFDILVATDKLSEGFNLSRAGLVVNYDIPWNPVRVIQRVGRINRIGQKIFQKLYIWNFFPTETGADITHQRIIAEKKMFMIHNAIGEDSKILSEGEEPSEAALFNKTKKLPDSEDRASFFARAKRCWNEEKKKNPALENKLTAIEKSGKAKIFVRADACSGNKEPRTVLFARRGNILVARSCSAAEVGGEIKAEDIEYAIESLECSPNTPSAPVPFGDDDAFWKNYKRLKADLEKPKQISTYTPREITNAQNAIEGWRAAGRLPEDLRDFANDLLDDMQNYRRLPKHTLLEIARENKKSKNRPERFLEFLRRLHSEVGDLKVSESAGKTEPFATLLCADKTEGSEQ